MKNMTILLLTDDQLAALLKKATALVDAGHVAEADRICDVVQAAFDAREAAQARLERGKA